MAAVETIGSMSFVTLSKIQQACKVPCKGRVADPAPSLACTQIPSFMTSTLTKTSYVKWTPPNLVKCRPLIPSLRSKTHGTGSRRPRGRRTEENTKRPLRMNHRPSTHNTHPSKPPPLPPPHSNKTPYPTSPNRNQPSIDCRNSKARRRSYHRQRPRRTRFRQEDRRARASNLDRCIDGRALVLRLRLMRVRVRAMGWCGCRRRGWVLRRRWWWEGW